MLNRITPELVAEALRQDIAGGRLLAGAVLRQEELAERFGVSRIPVREALRQLESEGVVVVRANRGARVRSFTRDELREIYDLRILLETDLLKRSVKRMTKRDLERLRNELRTSIAGGLRELDRRFHQALYEPAGRPQQLALVIKLRDSIAHYPPAERHMRRLKSDWQDDHRQIAQACERRDGAAAVRLLRHHLSIAAELTLGNLERDPARRRSAGYQL